MPDLPILYLIIPLTAGILSGYLLREKKRFKLDKATVGIILVLIFSLGFAIGSNNELLGSLPAVGLSAFAMAVLAIVFSVVSVVFVRRRLRI